MTSGDGSAAGDAEPRSRPLRVVVVDNYDSFTYNLVEYLSDTRLPGA